jgi:hypothetical protein
LEKVVNDEAEAPADLGERPIPIYKDILQTVFSRKGRVGLLDGWRRRPQSLHDLDHVYGFAPGHFVFATYSRDSGVSKTDIVLLAPHPENTPLNCNLMIAAGPDSERLGLELIFGTDPLLDNDSIEITKLSHLRLPRVALRRRDVVVHRILRMADVP